MANPPAPAPREPLLARLRTMRRRIPHTLHVPRSRTWLVGGLLALAGLAVLPLRYPGWYPQAQQASTLLALVFLLSAAGLWFGMRKRAFVVATALVALLAAVSRTSAIAFGVSDLFLTALVVSFVLFALSGFYLVLVLEEVVHDAHRALLRRGLHGWRVAPLLLLSLLGVLLPLWPVHGGPFLRTAWGVAMAALLLVGGWWLWRWATGRLHGGEDAVLREIHLFAVAGVAAALLVDLLGPLAGSTGLLPSLLAYLLLLGTWVYVTHTTLQRTHLLLPGRDARPWVALMLSASFAFLVHSRELFRAEGHAAVEALLGRRIGFVIVGLWVGLAFHLVRTMAEALLEMRRRSRARTAAAASSVAQQLARTESRLEDAAVLIFRGVDRILPGERQPPRRRTSEDAGREREP